MTEIVNTEPILGVTHLLVDGKLSPLYRCPLCNKFRNIYINEIQHHIEFTHPGTGPGKSYNVSDFYPKSHSTSPYQSKEQLKLPWIRCLFCRYRDKIEFDLSLHMLEKHKEKLLELPISSRDRKRTKALSGDFFARFEGAIEFRLDVAVEMAKQQNRGKDVSRHAIKILQKRAVQRRKAREQRGNDITCHYQRIAEILSTKPELIKNGECDIPNCVCHWVTSLKLHVEEDKNESVN